MSVDDQQQGEMFGPLRPGEEAELIALWHRSGLTRPWNPPEQDVAEILAHPHAAILVAREDNQIIAAVVVCHDGHRGWVYYLGVDPDCRRSGLGRQAMATAETWLKSKGLAKIQLLVRKTNAQVIDFYNTLGYEEGEVVLMQKWLNAERERLYRDGADGH